MPLRITPSVAEQEGQQTETEATGAPQKHHYTLNQQVGSITGYYNGNIDGIMGPSTRQSIKNYRIANGLPTPATETLDTQLLNSLNILAR
ncbi:hypothetical protein BME85_20840 [Klebsiella pneumoniae]|nr:hypothetical protein BME85_20840 [Klebsiella pneumoniae]